MSEALKGSGGDRSFMIELAPNIFYIPGENGSRFPYCACLYLKGRKRRVLIDAGMGTKNLAPVKEMGIDLLILTHCHIDHRLTRNGIGDIPVWCHERDAVYLKDSEYFLTSMGFNRSGLELPGLFDLPHGMFDIEIEHELADGERIELGGITLETIHTPGHAGPFNGNTAERLDAYGQSIHHRDHLLLEELIQPKSVEDLRGRRLFYKYYPEPADLIQWFEVVHIEKHLSRLSASGNVTFKNGVWQKNEL